MSIFDIVRNTKDKVKEILPKKDKVSIKDKKHENKFDETKLKINTNRDLLEEASNIGDLKRYNVMLQSVSISQNVKNYLNNNRKS